MKRRLCLENNCQTRKFEETTLFVAGKKEKKYIYIRRGPLLKKAREERKKKEEKREDRNVFSFTYKPQERFICLGG